MDKFEEFKQVKPATSWMLILLLTASIVIWGVAVYMLIPDGKRVWDFGTLPVTPAESIYSTAQPPSTTTAPSQIAPLPGARRTASGPAPGEVGAPRGAK